jgi:hypothetical protein
MGNKAIIFSPFRLLAYTAVYIKNRMCKASVNLLLINEYVNTLQRAAAPGRAI